MQTQFPVQIISHVNCLSSCRCKGLREITMWPRCAMAKIPDITKHIMQAFPEEKNPHLEGADASCYQC